MDNLEELSLIDCWHLKFQPDFLPKKLRKLIISKAVLANHHMALIEEWPNLKIESY